MMGEDDKDRQMLRNRGKEQENTVGEIQQQ